MIFNIDGKVINTNTKFHTFEDKYDFITDRFGLKFIFALSKISVVELRKAYKEDPDLNNFPDEMFYKWAGLKVVHGDVVEDKGYVTDWLKRQGMVVYNPEEIVNMFKYGLLKFYKII